MKGRIQNLKPWPKGVSGNPAGRPKRDVTAEIAQAVFENNADAIYRAMTRALCKGDAKVFRVLADRAYGKVKQQIEVDTSQGLAERLNAARRRACEPLTDDEIRARISMLERELLQRSAEPNRGLTPLVGC